MSIFIHSVNKAVQGLVEVTRGGKTVAEGDLTQRITRDAEGVFGQLKHNLNRAVEAVGQLVSDADTLAAAAVAQVKENVIRGNACTAPFCGPDLFTNAQGIGILTNALSAASASVWTIISEPNVSYITFGLQNSGSAGLTKQNGNSLLSSGNVLSFRASVRISGW